MTLSRDELERLTRLRALFLDDERGAEGLADYWRDDRDLSAYDTVLAERIGWKWDAVLDECASRGLPRRDDALHGIYVYIFHDKPRYETLFL